MYKLVKTSFTTDRLEIINNNLKPGNFKFSPKLTRKTGKISNKLYYTILVLSMKTEKDTPFPIDLHIEFRATFEFQDIEDETNVMNFLKLQAVHIMYPYLRTITTNLTVTAMMNPIILPVVDVSKLFVEGNEASLVN